MINPSEILEYAIGSGGGHIHIQCACGRTNFADSDNAGDWEDGELEDLRRRSKETADRCIAHPYDAVSSKFIFGSTYVHDCPCGWEKRISGLLIDNQEWVIRFYTALAKAKAEELAKEQAGLAGLEVKP